MFKFIMNQFIIQIQKYIQMSQNLQNKKIKKGFTKNYKYQTTFRNFLEKEVLIKMEKRSDFCDRMFNKSEISLSGGFYRVWRYSGKVLKDQKQLRRNQSYSYENHEKENESNETQIHTQESTLFLKLIKQAKWETASINIVHRTPDMNFLKQISCIDFPKLLNLELMGNHINSVQLLQTLNIPNLQQLDLCLNKITNIKSLRKLNCSNIKNLNLSVNFLNIDKTYQSLTRFNGQKLNYVNFQCQNQESIFQQVQTYLQGRRQNNTQTRQEISFQENHIRRIISQNYSNNNSTIRMQNLCSNIHYIFQRRRPIQRIINIRGDFNRNARRIRQIQQVHEPIEIIDYLIEQTLDPLAMLYKFLLKTNSDSQYLLNPLTRRRNTSCPSPYQYFIYYGTDIDKIMQQLQEQEEQRYNYWIDYQSDWGSFFEDYIQQWQHQDMGNQIIAKRGFFYK